MLTSLVIFISTFVYWSIFFKKYEEDQYPLIIVDGKKAPRLSPLSFHINKSDTDCMSCHVNNQIISIKDKNFHSMEMPHEFRDNCMSCHILKI